MHEFDLINNYFFKIAKKNKSALNLNDDVFFDKKRGVVISVDTYNIGTHFYDFKSPDLVIKKHLQKIIYIKSQNHLNQNKINLIFIYVVETQLFQKN